MHVLFLVQIEICEFCTDLLIDYSYKQIGIEARLRNHDSTLVKHHLSVV